MKKKHYSEKEIKEIGLKTEEIKGLLEEGFIFEFEPKKYKFLDEREGKNIIFTENGNK